MSRKWVVTLLLSIMSLTFAQQEGKNQSLLYYSNDCDIQITPAAGPRVTGPWNAFFTANFIYWTLHQEGLSYCTSEKIPSHSEKGVVHDLDWKWEPGFRLGGGCNLPYDGWDLQTQYTWIHGDARNSKSEGDSSTTLSPRWMVKGCSTDLMSAYAHWNSHYQNLCLEVGRNSYWSPRFKVRLHTGLEATWIDQSYSVQYTEKNEAIHYLQLEQKFRGIGLRTGLNTNWELTKNVSVFGDLALASIWGQFNEQRRENQQERRELSTVFNIEDHSHKLEPVLNLALGLRWEAWLDHDQLHFSMEAGWEHQLWLLHGLWIQKAGELYHRGDLSLQGLTLKGRFDF